jgi:galactitol-specific phosphotransferase system IIB component
MRTNQAVAAGLLAFVMACGGGSSSSKVTTMPVEQAAPADDGCPMTVGGTSVTVEDTAVGGALVFVTTGDAAELRARVRAWAEAHNAHHGGMGPLPTGEETAGASGGHDHGGHGGGGHGGAVGHGEHGGGDGGGGEHAGHGGHGGGGGGSAGGPMAIGVHSRATAVEIDGGARLELIAFPDQLAAMREELRGHAEHLAMGHCAMPSGS